MGVVETKQGWIKRGEQIRWRVRERKERKDILTMAYRRRGKDVQTRERIK